MPEPLLYLKAIGLATIVSAMVVFAIAGVRCPQGTTRLNLACVLAMVLGLAVGDHVLVLRLAWHPENGLGRLLTIVIPTTLGIELIAGFPRVSRWRSVPPGCRR